MNYSRRDFLKTAGIVTIGSTLPRTSILGSDSAWTSNSNTLKVGLIGCGGRGTAAAPQAIDKEGNTLPLYGIDENGKHHSNWAFTDIDASPTKSFIIENWQDKNIKPYFDWAHAKRLEWELFNIKDDPFCLVNISGQNEFSKIENEMKETLLNELRKSQDPRIVGPDKEIFDSYIRYSPIRKFPKPE